METSNEPLTAAALRVVETTPEGTPQSFLIRSTDELWERDRH
jgi:hypothetical protein